MKTVAFPAGEVVPALGLGTWRMGERAAERDREVRALARGLDLGMTLVDTAEMYGDGGAERVVRDAIAGRRDEVFLVSKVLPYNASAAGTVKACENSLRRLGTEVIDLYLLHWPGRHRLEETVTGFERLRRDGKIRFWGVSNFDTAGMDRLAAVSGDCQTNQILYNPARRGVEWDLLAWCARRSMPVMAYSPLEQGRLDPGGVLGRVAGRHGATPMQVALAWCMRDGRTIVIPKASSMRHVEENRAADAIVLTDADLAELDAGFPPPRGPEPLDIL